MLYSEAMKTVRELFIRLGGPALVARHLSSVTPSAASMMMKNNSVQVKHWPKLLEICKEKRVAMSYNKLVEMHVNNQYPF